MSDELDENVNSTNDTVDVDLETDQTDIDTNEDFGQSSQEEKDAKITRLEEKNKQLFERAKKAEGFVKVDGAWVKKSQPQTEAKPAAQIINNPDTISREEVVLLTQGYDDEDLKRLNIVAKGSGVSLSEAKSDPMFVAYLEQKKEEQRKKKAQLGASKGSGTTKQEDDFNRPLTDEEHKALWKKRNG